MGAPKDVNGPSMLDKKERQRHIFLLFCDLVAILASLPMAHAFRRDLTDLRVFFADRSLPLIGAVESYLWFYSVSAGIFLLFHVYHARQRTPYRFRYLPGHLLVLLAECLTLGFAIGFVSFLFKLDLSRSVTFLFLVTLFLLCALHRILYVAWVKSRKGVRSEYRRVLVAGNSPKLFEMGRKIASHKDQGYYLVGYVTDCAPAPGMPCHGPVLGTLNEAESVLGNHVVDEVIFVSSTNGDLKLFEGIALLCEELGIITRLSLHFFPHAISRTSLDFVENQPFLSFSPVPEHALSLVFKRFLDVVGALAGILVSLPFLVAVPLLIRLTSRGPAVYRQVRCGLYGRKFTLYKFRSMVHGAEDILWEIRHLNEMNGPVFKMRDDPRITALGRFLRKTSIDELPQFFNVLKGDMSLVGPRAPLPEEVREYTRWQRRRLSVKPGLTCLWQVSGRNEVDFDEWMKLDLKYIDSWSLWLDFKILLRTIPTVLFCRGAR